MNEDWKCTIPDATHGSATIETFEVLESAAMIARIRGDKITPGLYKKLLIDGQLVMSDTPDEMFDHARFMANAHGNVLINGLGLGCCLNVITRKISVKHVTVIEKNADVIALVGSHFPDVEIIHADAFEYRPPKFTRYDVVWHDIWTDICIDNLPEMHKLHRIYGNRANWQASWKRAFLERIKKHD